MKRTSTLICLIFIVISTYSQNLIGYNKSDIAKIMKEDHKEYSLSKSTRNPVHKYLKFEDRSGTRTLLYFLSDDNICSYYKFIADYSRLNSTVKSLDEKHKKTGETSWSEEIDGIKYKIELEKGEWFFTITTRKTGN